MQNRFRYYTSSKNKLSSLFSYGTQNAVLTFLLKKYGVKFEIQKGIEKLRKKFSPLSIYLDTKMHEILTNLPKTFTQKSEKLSLRMQRFESAIFAGKTSVLKLFSLQNPKKLLLTNQKIIFKTITRKIAVLKMFFPQNPKSCCLQIKKLNLQKLREKHLSSKRSSGLLTTLLIEFCHQSEVFMLIVHKRSKTFTFTEKSVLSIFLSDKLNEVLLILLKICRQQFAKI